MVPCNFCLVYNLIQDSSVYRIFLLPKFSPSWIVSGKLLPRVSGKNSAKIPPVKAIAPKMTNGRGVHVSLSMLINGLTMPPILPDIETTPIPTFLKPWMVSFKAYNWPDIANSIWMRLTPWPLLFLTDVGKSSAENM